LDLCSSDDDDDDSDVEVVGEATTKSKVSTRAAKITGKLGWDEYDDDDDDDEEMDDSDDFGEEKNKKTKRKFGVEDIIDIEEELEWLEQYIASVKALKLPSNALDEILDKLGGFDKVAEMSGRTSRLVRNWKDEFVYEKRSANGVSMDEQNIFEREEFQAGRKLVAIISDAASAGISLQSDLRARNQKRRVHITLELPWSADKTIQQMGRSHRTNQRSAPEYKLLVSPLGGERRFVAAVVKRLESLGALTQGDRRATGVTKSWSCFNVDTKEGAWTILDIYHHSHRAVGALVGHDDGDLNAPLVRPPKIGVSEARAVAKICVDNPDIVDVNEATGWLGSSGDVEAVAAEIDLLHAAKLWLSLVGINVDSYEDVDANKLEGVVSRFLNRILGLEISRQQWLFDYFARYLEKTIKAAVRDGTLHRGIGSMGGRVVAFKDRTKLRLTTPATTPVEVLTIHVDKGLDYDDACAKLREAAAGGDDENNNASSSRRTTRRRRERSGGTTSVELGSRQQVMFGERDGFRLIRNGQFAVLIIEVGDASMRGLSVQTDKFMVFFPHRLPEAMRFETIRNRFPNDVTPGQAKIPWERGFNTRTKFKTDRIVTGPILYIWSDILNAQYLEDAYAKDTVRVVRAEEHDQGKKSGNVALGVILDFARYANILKRLEQKKHVTDANLVRLLLSCLCCCCCENFE